MSPRIAAIALTLTLPLAVAAAAPPETRPASDPQAAARAFADHLVAARFDEAAAMFDDRLAALMDAAKLRETWHKLAEQCGDFAGFDPPRAEESRGATIVVFPGRWKGLALDMQVTVSADGRIGGLWFRPSKTAAPYKPPGYVKPDRFTERDVEFGDDDWRLKGRLTLPKKTKRPGPAAILVHGSGPNDMDETIGPNRPFRDLALGLASRGVAVLRYDKRTHAHRGRLQPADVNVRTEVIDDAIAALRLIRRQDGIDPKRTFLIGHSLGGCLAPVIAELDGNLAGIVILSGTLRPMDEVILDQLAYIASLPGEGRQKAEEMFGQARADIDRFRSGDLEDFAILGAPADYWRDLNGYLGSRGAEAARRFTGRILVLGGGRDYQITRADFDRWAETLAAHPDASLHWIADANHLFAAGKGMSTPAEYLDKPRHVKSSVVAGIARWIHTGRYETGKPAAPEKGR